MAIPYKKRFDGRVTELIEFANTFGVYKAFDHFVPEGGDLGCFWNFLRKASGNQDIGVNPKVTSDNPMDTADYIVASLWRKYRELEAERDMWRAKYNEAKLETERKQRELAIALVNLKRELNLA